MFWHRSKFAGGLPQPNHLRSNYPQYPHGKGLTAISVCPDGSKLSLARGPSKSQGPSSQVVVPPPTKSYASRSTQKNYPAHRRASPTSIPQGP